MADRRSFTRSLTRFMVGSVLSVYDMVATRINEWNAQQDEQPATAIIPGETSITWLPDSASAEPGEPGIAEDRPMRHALIGLVFETEERLHSTARTIDRATRLAGNVAGWFIGPVYNSGLFTPVRTRFENLVERGAGEIDRWIATGRVEDAQSRALVQSVVQDRVEDAINYLAADETVQELVQSQSTGLANEVVEETRERTVSADSFLEALLRSILRMPTRQELPEPPPDVQAQAIHTTRQLPPRVPK